VLEIGDYMRARGRDKDQAGALQLTIAKFYRVTGGSPQLLGVIPDVHIPSPEDLPNSGESAEKYPLPYDEILPVPFKKIAAHPLSVPELQERSAARVAASPEFAYLLEDLRSDTRILTLNRTSLNEAVRRAALAEDRARESQRTAARAKREPLPEKTYLVTLDNVRKPGLQLVSSGQLASPLDDERKTTDHPAEADESKAPAVDAVREETLHVLSDLIALSHSQKSASDATHPVP